MGLKHRRPSGSADGLQREAIARFDVLLLPCASLAIIALVLPIDPANVSQKYGLPNELLRYFKSGITILSLFALASSLLVHAKALPAFQWTARAFAATSLLSAIFGVAIATLLLPKPGESERILDLSNVGLILVVFSSAFVTGIVIRRAALWIRRFYDWG